MSVCIGSLRNNIRVFRFVCLILFLILLVLFNVFKMFFVVFGCLVKWLLRYDLLVNKILEMEVKVFFFFNCNFWMIIRFKYLICFR